MNPNIAGGEAIFRQLDEHKVVERLRDAFRFFVTSSEGKTFQEIHNVIRPIFGSNEITLAVSQQMADLAQNGWDNKMAENLPDVVTTRIITQMSRFHPTNQSPQQPSS